MALIAPSRYRTVKAEGFRWTHVPERHVSAFRNDWLLQRQVVGFDSPITNIGALVYLGHDDIQPRGMFPMHPHRGIEVLSYILSGRIEHEDTTGAKGWLTPGELGHMLAGRGVRHSERNPDDSLLSLFQIFILLDAANRHAEPAYRRFDANAIPQSTDKGVTTFRLLGEGAALTTRVPVEISRYVFQDGSEQARSAESGSETLVYTDAGTLEVAIGDVVVTLAPRDELVLELDATVPLRIRALGPAQGIVVSSPTFDFNN
jgi:redox-sensitive bicupin YhaK (pirin superfamily)